MFIHGSAGTPSRVVHYGVSNGFWDGVERRFGGFLEGRRIVGTGPLADTLIEDTRYMSGLGEDRVLRGTAWYVRQVRGTGEVHQVTKSDVNALSVAGLAGYTLLKKPAVRETRTYSYEGNATSPIETLTTYTYDTEVRPIEEYQHGIVGQSGDEAIVRRAFASDESFWVRDRVTDAWLFEGDGTKQVSYQKFYFGDYTPAILPHRTVGKGWPRKTEAHFADLTDPMAPGRFIKVAEVQYDLYANPIRAYAGGIWRTLGYDADSIHPIRETVSPQTDTDLIWQMAWDNVLGQPATLTDPNGDVTTVGYDDLGRLTQVAQNSLPAHARYAYQWDVSAGPILTRSFVFDGAEADLPALANAWQNGAPWRESVAVVNGVGESLYAATRLSAARWIIGGYNERDARGRTIYVADNVEWPSSALPTSRPPGTEARAQRLTYDALGRLVTQTLPTGAQKQLSYQAFCQTVTADDLAPVSSCSDGLGRVIHTERVVETGTEFVDATYDAAGRITAMTLPQAVQHTFAYDSLGRLVGANDPDIGPRKLSYNDQGFLIEHQNGIPQSVTFTYDNIGRLVTRSSDGATFTYHYDVQKDGGNTDRVLGRLGWVDEPDGHVELAYDQFGRAVTTRRTIKTLTASETTTLSPSGLVLSSSHENSSFFATVNYDPAGRAVQVNSGAGLLWQALELDPAGRVMHEQFGNGVTQTTARDVLGQPSDVKIYRPGEPVPNGVRYYDVALTRNAYGAVTDVVENDGDVGLDHNATFAYDSAGRLTGATMGTSPDAYQFDYTYDSLQNMITRQQPAGPTSLGTLLGSYRYREASAGPRQLSSVLKDDGTVHNFTYDAAGRVTDDGGTLLTYNGLDQLVSAQLPSEANPVEHGYGYDGLRTFTRDPQGNEQYWFTPNLRQHDGLREHYIKLGNRIIAKITQQDDGLAPVDAGLADARVTTSPSGRGSSRYAQPAARPAAAALFTLCLLFFASAIVRRRGHARWARAVASTCIVALFTLLTPACSWIGRSERPVWQHQTTTYFHYGFGAGPTLMTRQSGTVLEERRYEPFGQPIDASRETDRKNPKTRTGPIDHVAEPTNSLNKETDPTTGFSYHGARWMAPQTARWLTPDPPVKGPDPKFMAEPWAMHPYQYVGQNPVIYWDPDGRKRVKEIDFSRWQRVALHPYARGLMQGDYEHVPYPNAGNPGATIKSSGCGVISACIAIRALGIPISVADATWFSLANNHRAKNGTWHSYFPHIARETGLDYEPIPTSMFSLALDEAFDALLTGDYIAVLSVSSGKNGERHFTGTSHFIALGGAGIDENGQRWINVLDPNGRWNATGNASIRFHPPGDHAIMEDMSSGARNFNAPGRFWVKFETLDNEMSRGPRSIHMFSLPPEEQPAWSVPE